MLAGSQTHCLRDTDMKASLPETPKSMGCNRRDIAQQFHRRCTWPTVWTAAHLCAHSDVERRCSVFKPLCQRLSKTHTSSSSKNHAKHDLSMSVSRWAIVKCYESTEEKVFSVENSLSHHRNHQIKCQCHSAASITVTPKQLESRLRSSWINRINILRRL